MRSSSAIMPSLKKQSLFVAVEKKPEAPVQIEERTAKAGKKEGVLLLSDRLHVVRRRLLPCSSNGLKMKSSCYSK